MTTQHTNGPWAIEWNHYKTRPDFIRSFVDGEMQDIVEMSDEGNDSETLANANLISSAPDMFQALQAICDAFGDQNSLLVDQCKAALAKAKGEA